MFFKINKERSVFKHVLVNGLLILLIFNAAYLSLLIPFAKEKAITFIDRQSEVFFNSSVIAIKEDIYLNNYSSTIELLMKFIDESKSFEYVILDINRKEKDQILITGKKWQLIDLNTQNIINNSSNGTLLLSNPYTKQEVFEYSYAMNVHGLPLGIFTVGTNTSSYHALLDGIYKFIVVLNILQILGTLLILALVTKKFRKHLLELQESAANITKGDFTKRVGLSDISEVNRLSKSFNQMAISLDEQTNKSLMLAQVVKNTHDGVIIVEKNGNVKYANQAFAEMSGIDGKKYTNISEIEGNSLLINRLNQLLEGIYENDSDLPYAVDLEVKNTEIGEHYECYIDYFSHNDQDAKTFYVVMSDITGRKELESELNKFAYIDKLTELPNRRAFMDRLEEYIGLNKRNNLGFSLMFLDLDDFKIVNDSLGHDYGDEVLKHFANQLKFSLRSNDIICRLGGDEFTVLLPNLTE